ncbi:hypothetical protein ABFT23_18345 [Nocardioides sp. C4-1]|uniref:hypothetical protein n=1 Tax=Nocardioides sp. C4-1 TaxID=3151851 RepID=UPI00326792B0
MSPAARALGLPALALVLVAVVLGVQLAQDGGDFEPARTADPCAPREVTSQSDGIEGLTERLVLLGIDGAACRLDVSREELTLEIGQGAEPTDAEVDALREGLHAAVQRLDDDGDLPPISDLTDEALDNADLNRFLEAAIRALPDRVVDGALKTDDVLDRAIDDLDLRRLLNDLDDADELNQQVAASVEQAVKDALLDRLRNLI